MMSQAVHAARREDRPIPGRERRTGRARRPLLPPHGEALEGLEQGRAYRVRVSRLGIRPHRQAGERAAIPIRATLPDARAKAFHCDTKYGYAWVALDEPLLGIPDLVQDGDPSYRRIHQFDDRWNTGALRMMENSFDNAHFSFVHKSTFGQQDQPKPEKYELIETDYGFQAEFVVPIKNPPIAHRVTGTSDPVTTRHMRNAWFMPFCRTLDIEYPSGLRHIIFNSATPIDDGSIQLVQILFRNDREEDCSTEELIEWDAAIIAEDRDILELTDPDAIVDTNRKLEMHMPSDRPGMLMRKRLLTLLKEHGEVEVARAG